MGMVILIYWCRNKVSTCWLLRCLCMCSNQMLIKMIFCLLVTGATNDMWNFDSARLFLNNGDGTFVENTNMLPTNEELRNSNAPSPLYTDNGMFVPLTLVDFTNEGFADLYFSSGNARTTGALFKNKKLTDPNSNQWNAIKTTDSIVLGEKTVSNSGCGSDSTHPIGHVFFDG